MLIFKCANCRKKIWRYLKIGKGEVLRCHKERIDKFYQDESAFQTEEGGHIFCQKCGLKIGIDKGPNFHMVKGNVTYSGHKENKR